MKRTKKDKTNAQAEIKKELAESKNMLKLIINSIPQHIFWKDINSVFMGCNNNFAKAVGLNNPRDIIGKTDFDLADKDKAEHFIETDKKVINENRPIYNMIENHKQSNGDEIWINITKVPLIDSDGKTIGILGAFENITERRNLEDKLTRNNKKYKELIESTNTAYVILDAKLKIIEANQIFLNLLKCSSHEQILTHRLRSWVSPKDISRFDNYLTMLEKQNKPIIDFDIELRDDNNHPVFVSVNANTIENGGRRVLCLIRDISNRKNLENKEYVEKQKKKDRIKQNIIQIRKELDKLKGIND